ncbi:uncharacterized protein LOC128430554 [Pleuronectes platessa]|uniref:uncharacterized protein LOC128430554 n=1 Tax=Pleuronectes platessa TaxID=8262 RepID=UPI00232A5FB8|nr:uncharacterized protein LOC128430554 [Pleuronectes platessa]
MVGGRLRCLSCFFTHSELLLHLLLLGVCLHHVEASGCELTVHKQVGDTVEFSSCLSPGIVTVAEWEFNNSLVVDKKNVTHDLRFKGRVKLNPPNYSLTVKKLTLQDSGDFLFISEVNGKQMPTVTIRLHVQGKKLFLLVQTPLVEYQELPLLLHLCASGIQFSFRFREELNNLHLLMRGSRCNVSLSPRCTSEPSTPPDISFNSTFHPSNESCTVWLECLSTPDSNVHYSWSVRNQTLVGPRLRYTIRPQDGGTNFTCTISSSESSTSETVTCVNSSSDSISSSSSRGLAAGGVLIVGLVAVIVVCHCKQRPADQDSTDLTVYADITEAAEESNVPRTSMKCSVYETVGDPVNAVKPGPHTVYDKIQLGRMKAAPVSLYQDAQGIRQ